MTDALALIAEAQSRQKKAELECAHWKRHAEHHRKRCKLLIEMMRRVPIEPPVTGGHADWDQCERIVKQFTEVISDPYAAYDSDNNDHGLTHASAQVIMASRLMKMVEDAMKLGKAEAQREIVQGVRRHSN